jgi:hypothetical protein
MAYYQGGGHQGRVSRDFGYGLRVAVAVKRPARLKYLS